MMRSHYGKGLVVALLALAGVVTAVQTAERPTTEQKTCVTAECHASYGQLRYVHGPVALGDCKSCHTLTSAAEHTYALTRQGKDLCAYCHLEQDTGKNLHEPLKTGECASCHDPHGSNNRFLLVGGSVEAMCAQCHQADWRNRAVMHGPVGTGECTLCHNAHSSDHEALLIETREQICYFCHETTHDELERLEFTHEPVTQGCSQCHDAHASDYPMILKASVPDLCYSCHEDVQQTVHQASHKHLVVAEPDGCSTCHSPHASSVRYGLKAAPIELCSTCHNETIPLDDGKELASFTAEISGKPFLHGPVGENDCRSCHNSHGSDHFRLLVEDYPSRFYAPFHPEDYELCFTCHADTLVTTQETTDLTDFRNGAQNLHYLHVHMPERGRTCRSCHATHAASLPHNMRESVPYGQWELPIQFAATETGGSCQPGCHKAKEYDRNQPVDYTFTPPVATAGPPEKAAGGPLQATAP